MVGITYFQDNAALRITDRIFEEQEKMKETTRTRDKHRAETTIRALKEALQFVILEKLCNADGQRHPMPNVEEYLLDQARKRTPIV